MGHPLPKSHPLYMQMLEYEIKQHPRNASYDLVAQFGPKNYIQYWRWCQSRGYTPEAHQKLFPLINDEVQDEDDVHQARKLLKILADRWNPIYKKSHELHLKKRLAQHLSPVWGAWEWGNVMNDEYGGRIQFGKLLPIWVINDHFPENYFKAQDLQELWDGVSVGAGGGWDDPAYRDDFLESLEWQIEDGEIDDPYYYGGAVRLNPKSITLEATWDRSDAIDWEHKDYLKLHGIERLSDILSYVCWDWIDMKQENPYLYSAKVIYDAIGYNPKLQPPQVYEDDWENEIVFFPTRKMPAETMKKLHQAAINQVKDIMATTTVKLYHHKVSD